MSNEEKKKVLGKSPIKIRRYLDENFPGFNQFFASGFALSRQAPCFQSEPELLKNWDRILQLGTIN
jgi:hypothetical protein